MMLPINTVKMRFNVNFLDYTSFQKSIFHLPIKRAPPNPTIITMAVRLEKLTETKLGNLVKRSLKLIYLNNKKDKIDGKANIVCSLNLNMQ